MGNPRQPAVRYALGQLVGHVTSVAQIKTVQMPDRSTCHRRHSTPLGSACFRGVAPLAPASVPNTLICASSIRAAIRNSCMQAIVRIPRWHRHNKLDIDVRRNSKIWAHDEYGMCAVGDKVRIEPCRALSKRKAHVVSEILKKEDGSEPPRPFPKW